MCKLFIFTEINLLIALKRNRKIARIRWLMIFSQLLLFVFLCQWIINHYENEKVTLARQLRLAFIDSEQAMTDSLILFNIVNPFIKNKNFVDINIIDTLKSKDQHEGISKKQNDFIINNKNKAGYSLIDTSAIKHITIDKRNGKNAMIFSFDAKVDSISKNDKHEWKSIDGLEQVLAQTYKVYINHSKGLNGINESIHFSSASNVDTNLLKKEFIRRLDDYKLKAIWVDTTSSTFRPYFYFKSEVLGLNIGAVVTNARLYLFKKLAPNIVFGLILLLLTGIAFSISFLNLKKQIQLNLMRNEFVSNITHELKTPVSTVKVALEALQKFDLKSNPVRSDEYIQIAIKEADRLEVLIQKVLVSSVLVENNNVLNIELINYSELIDDILIALRIRFENENADVVFTKPDEDILLKADKMHLQGVLFNLLDNSLKYTNLKPEIQIELYQSGRMAILKISDNGIGIPDEYRTKVFEKFFRVPTDNKHNIKGYGLGLNYAHSVVKLHKGSIELKNNPANGCKFIISLPIQEV